MKLKKLKPLSKAPAKAPVSDKRGDSIRRAIASIPSTPMLVRDTNGKTFMLPSVLLTHFADKIGFPYQSFWRWIDKGQLPAPCFFDASASKDRGVYSLQEAQAIAAKLADHFTSYDYLRKSHTGTISGIFRTVEAIRKQLKVQHSGETHGTAEKTGRVGGQEKPRLGQIRKGGKLRPRRG